MLGIIISLCIALLVMYALYNMLGYYDGDHQQSNNEIKDIENLFSQKENKFSSQDNKLFTVVKSELDTSIIRNLDQQSQESIKYLNEHGYVISLGDFLNFCDDNYTKLMKAIHEKNIDLISILVNDVTLEKIQKISTLDVVNFNLLKIDEILIQSVAIYDNEFITIIVKISSQEMHVVNDDYQNQNVQRVIKYAVSFKDLSENKWIIVDISDERLFQ